MAASTVSCFQSRIVSTSSSRRARSAFAVVGRRAPLRDHGLAGGLVVGDLAHEEEGGVLEEALEGVDPLLHEGEHLEEVVLGEELRPQPLEELLRREAPQVLPVQPLQLLDVEDRSPERDALERERLDELLERELLALVGHGPAHEGEVVEHRLREVARAPVEVEAHRVLALRDLRAVGVAQQRQVAEDRLLPAEAPVELHVLRQRRQPLLRPDDVGDAHEVVVHHVREVVGGEAVALQQDLVVHLRVVEAHLAAQEVPHDGLAPARHREADDVRLARRPAALGLVPRAARGSGRRSRSSPSSPSAPPAARRGARGCRSRRRRRRGARGPPRARGRSPSARSGGRARGARRRRGPRPTAGPASAGPRRSWPRSPASCAPDRCPRSAGRTARRACARGRS